MSTLNYSMVFPFEEKFQEKYFLKWMNENWELSILYSGVYLLVIFGGKWYMENRPRYDLRPALALWSGLLGLFSIFGALRTWPELVHNVNHHGLQHSVCVPSFYENKVTVFWAFLFTISKAYELGDTVFIVLRKQQLIFLHWYHHITVLMYAWYSYKDHTASCQWFMTINYTVHSFMYTYYTLRALRIAVPKQVNICITAMQLVQMIIGCAINVWVYQIKGRREYCNQTYTNLQLGLLMYLSYFVLFANFFYNTYIVKGAAPIKKTT